MGDKHDPAPDYAALYKAEREAREKACQKALEDAMAPVLAQYRCRMSIIQTIVDGVPGPIKLTVVAND